MAWTFKALYTNQLRHKQRGSVMLLTVVSLLMMAMIGMAYLQVSRLDRVTASQLSANNIDIVAAAVSSYIGEVLVNDLVDGQGNFFNETNGIESYDYPWTNFDARFNVTKVDGNTKKAAGGMLDDTWLAATEPDFSGSDPKWPHITNLTGIFLELPKSDKNKTQPKERIIKNKDPQKTDTNVPITGNKSLTASNSKYEATGVDVDGDGIVDSRWTWATLRQISGISYIMAVRIVDNSAMLNANVALSQVSAADTFDTSSAGINAPRWSYPSELDLGNFVFKSGGSTSELQQFLQYRLGTGTTPALPLPWTSMADSRAFFWLAGPSLFGNFNHANVGVTTSYRKLSIVDELELRYKNGLNNDRSTTTVESTSNGLSGLLRESATGETNYTDVPGVNSMRDFFEKEPRHQMTLFNGASIMTAPLPGETKLIVKRDLNMMVQHAPGELATQIQTVFATGETPDWPKGITNAQALADQFTANLVDYADADNQLSERNGRFGVEALPMLTEVYVQRPYTVAMAFQWPYSPQRWYMVMLAADTQHQPGYVIEIRNPFKFPISLKNIHLYADSTKLVNGLTGDTDLDAIAGSSLAAVNSGDRRLLPEQALVLYHKSSLSGNNSGNHDVTQLIEDDSPGSITSPVRVSMSDQPLLVANSMWSGGDLLQARDIRFELRAENEQGNELAWPYSQITGKAFRTSTSSLIDFGIVRTNEPDLLGQTVFIQYSRFANPQGLNALAYASNEMRLNQTKPSFNFIDLFIGGTPQFINVHDRLGLEDKSEVQLQKNLPGNFNRTYYAMGFGDEKFDPKKNQWIISNQGFDSVGEIAHVPAVGPNASKTIAQALGTASSLKLQDFMLDIHSDRLVSTNDTHALALPHALVLMERLVTLSPDEDGLDNDGDGAADSADPQQDELFVAGTVNLNTATAALLNKVLPITDSTLRSNVIDDIFAYRDQQPPYDNNNRHVGGNYRNSPGMAMISELYNVDAGSGGTNVLATNGNDDDAINGTVIDFLANPDATTPDNVKDDREEETLLCRQLSSVLSTRSDIFTAYVYLRGYPAGDFRLGAVETKRFFVVYDRSGVVNAQSPAKILGIYEMR